MTTPSSFILDGSIDLLQLAAECKWFRADITHRLEELGYSPRDARAFALFAFCAAEALLADDNVWLEFYPLSHAQRQHVKPVLY